MTSPCLLVRLDHRVCALRLSEVEEVFRPLPTTPIAGAPPGVLGLALVRGRPTPVVDLAELLGASGQPVTRYVSVRAGERPVVLAVAETLGLADLDEEALGAMPPLLQESRPELVQAMGRLDGAFLMLISAARVLPERTWEELRAEVVH